MAIILNILLFLCKFAVGTISGSVAILADAWNNILDAGNAVVSLAGVKISSVGSGDRHPLGHGRFEWLTSLFCSFIVMLAGYELVQNSIQSIRHPNEITVNLIVALVLILSIGVKLFMFTYCLKEGKKKDSETLKPWLMIV